MKHCPAVQDLKLVICGNWNPEQRNIINADSAIQKKV